MRRRNPTTRMGIRQVAEKFDLDYTAMRRLLQPNGVRFRRQGVNRPRA